MNSQELFQMLKNYHPFDVLQDDELRKIIATSKYNTFNKNEFIFHEEQTIDDLEIFFLVSGVAKNVLHRSNGKQFSLRFYYPGDLIGLMILMTSGQMTFSVQAIEECNVFRMNKVNFFKVMGENAEFSRIIFDSIGDRMKTLYDEIKAKPSSQDSEENISLFRTKVQSLMDTPVTITEHSSMLDAASLMDRKNKYGLVVTNDQDSMSGILTQNEIVQYVLNPISKKQVKDWMQPKPQWVRDEAFAYEALSFFKHEDASFVPVLRNQTVVGTLTTSSFLNIQDSDYLDLSYKIQKVAYTEDLINLAAIKNNTFHRFIEELLDQDSFAYDVCEVLSNYNDRLHRKVIQLTEKEMIEQGYGPPPINYCFIVMGSQGRSEQGFFTDQDNGIILDDYHHLSRKEMVDKYFEIFTEKLNEKLVLCGFPLCTGGIMAKETKWKRTTSDWKKAIQDWLFEIDAEEVQNFTMFFDFRPVYGDYSLADEIRNEVRTRSQKSLSMQQLLRKDALRFRLPVGPLGRVNFKVKGNQFDLKKSGLMQLVNMIRIHAVKYGVKEVNTVKRLHALKNLEAFHPRDVKNAMTALHYFLSFRTRQNLQQLKENKPLTNTIDITSLSKEDKRKLKESIQIAHRMQQVMEISFNRNRVV